MTSDTRYMAQVAALRTRLLAMRGRPSFLDMLRSAKIRSDDPIDPGLTPWQEWPALLERAEAWERGESEVILKARQLGFTWLLALYARYRAAHTGATVGILSVGQRESREVLRRIRLIDTFIGERFKAEASYNADDIRYDSGGAIHAFPSTEQAGISYTFQVAIMDEAAFHPYGQANYAALRPTLSAGGQFIALSTADPSLGPAGFFYELYWASRRGETPYRGVFVPWYSRPSRDERWYAREKAAFAGAGEEFDAYYPETDAAAFVARSGLVYPMWQPHTHIVAAHPHPWEQTKARIAGVDFGGGDPTAVVVLGMLPNRAIHQYAEYYKRGPVTVEEIGYFLKEWHTRKPFASIECDPSQATAIASLAAIGLPAVAADNQRAAIGLTGSLLEQRRLTIHADCRSSISEFAGYRWSERVDPHDRTRYATHTPVDHHGDAMDARRYALKRLIDWEESLGPSIQTLSGRPMRKSAV